MIRTFCNNFVNFICENNYTSDEKEIMEYALRVFIFEFLKLIGTLIIFSLFGYFFETLLVLLAISFVKPFIGGLHCTSQLRCFLLSLIINLFIIILSQSCSLSFPGILIIIFTSIYAIYNQAPIINEQMPLTKPELIKKNRKRGFIALFIISLSTVALFFYNIYFSYILTWSILSLAVLMFNRLTFKEILKP